jgi:hypothetical protein
VVNELVGRINGKFGKYCLNFELEQWLIEPKARSNSSLSISCTSPSISMNLLRSMLYQMPALSRPLATV